MNSRALTHLALVASLLLFALVAGAAEVVRFGYLELNEDPRYDERKAFFRTLSRPLGAPFAGAEVALRESRFVGQAIGVSFDLVRARGADAPALLAELEKLHAEGVRHPRGRAQPQLRPFSPPEHPLTPPQQIAQLSPGADVQRAVGLGQLVFQAVYAKRAAASRSL